MAAVLYGHRLLLCSSSINSVPISCWRWDKALYEREVKLQLNFLIAVSTGELLRNIARPFVFRATSALSSPVRFMLDSLFFFFSYEKPLNVCLYLSLCLQRVFEKKKVRSILIAGENKQNKTTTITTKTYWNAYSRDIGYFLLLSHFCCMLMQT